MRDKWLLFSGLFYLFRVPVADAAETIGVKTLEQAFAISSVVSDSDALTFGIANFDLNYIVDDNDADWGNEKTLELKKSINIFILPYHWQLPALDNHWTQGINMRAFYLEVQRDTEPLQGFTNFKHEQVYGAFIDYGQHYQLDQQWSSELSLGSYLMYYRNKYQYSAGFPEQLIDILDGHIFNTSATVLMFEPVVKFAYLKQQSWGQWKLHNSNHYILGRGIGGAAKDIRDVTPEGWRITNGIEFKIDVPNLWGVSDHIAFDFNRIDVGGDISGLSDSGHYYETGIGWVIDTKNKIPFLDNVGIGLSFNYGSSLSGGTIVLYYNE